MTATNDLAPAWLLHRRPFRNTSLIVDLFVPERGRLGAVARGGRRNPALAPFVPLWVSLKAGGELFTLRHSEPRGAALPLAGRALFCGFYVNELVMRLLHRDDAHPDLWPIYERTLGQLAGDAPLDVSLRRFELMLLEEVGYGLTLDQDAEGRPLEAGLTYRWVPEQGFLVAAGGYPGEWLVALGEDRWNGDVRRMAKALLREALAPHLGDRPLRSRELFR
ncbi:DNA repair protein RecO [Alloalcanivorax gelatiniphagus]|uniref:DNA repair protein RecO n=1 Tax=Alloalcanivorax gelatiniphagus TaxID=1194167 RepID=A0ABY2XKR8_9GAMM|nr:DNA repair protein RecO [Alloalcanivorax gelatiniphagus]TMW12729.1 DNA repair protein RecO [Alloalcanivorax gelatiniphagus]|tara:strand:+ start:5606 stop:6268 length:663 start_codon:yes stop_codon:yes gene_type:complete